jgi:hypothetical protein
MRVLTLLFLLTVSSASLSANCSNEAVVRLSDNNRSATIYVVCPELSTLADDQAIALVKKYIEENKNWASEFFIQFLVSEKYIGYMEKEPYKIPSNELIADFYNGTGRLYFWPGTKKERMLTIHEGHNGWP